MIDKATVNIGYAPEINQMEKQMTNKPTINIDYIPSQNGLTRFEDCIAIAPDGSVWEPEKRHWFLGNRWKRVAKKEEKEKTKVSGAILSLLTSLSAILFLPPVYMSFGHLDYAFGILAAITALCGYIFYVTLRYNV